MGLTAIIGDALTDHSAHPFGLFIDGLDVILEHRGGGAQARFWVPIDTIAVTEAGPGAVSSMSFTLEDPLLTLGQDPIASGARIEYWDLTNNWPVFAGFVQSTSQYNDFGQQARSIDVTAYGLEALLDTVVVPGLIVHGQDAQADGTVARLPEYIALITGFGPLRNFTAAPAVGSSQATPIGHRQLIIYGWGLTAQLGNIPVDVTGLSLRSAIETIMAAETLGDPPCTVFLSVDFYGGVRAFAMTGSNFLTDYPTDYTTLTVVDDPAAASKAAANLTYTKDLSPQAVVNAVYVKGAAAASTGWVVGDTSTGRRETSTTTAGLGDSDKQGAALAILSNKGYVAGRGEFDLLDFTPVNAHPGGQLLLTDDRFGWASKQLTITEISKRFKSNGKQDWHVSFMDPTTGSGAAGAPSVTNLTRTLTRGTN